MSRYCKVLTQFTDQDALLSALMETGSWTQAQVEIHNEPQNLLGYKGDVRVERAHIIIRKKNVGRMSNDIGFVRNGDGNYEAIISEYDSSRYGERWIGELKGNYAYHKIKAEQENCGRDVCRERTSAGRQRITVTGYR